MHAAGAQHALLDARRLEVAEEERAVAHDRPAERCRRTGSGCSSASAWLARLAKKLFASSESLRKKS